MQYRGYLHPVMRNRIRLHALAEVEALARPGRRPSPWFASPPKAGAIPGKIVTRRSDGREAAHVFRLLDQGLSLRAIVTRAHVPPYRVRELHREWARALEHGSPPNPHTLGDTAELSELAAGAQALFEGRG